MMSMPGPEHERLAALVGEWEGGETVFPSPWDPAGGRAIGRWRSRLDIDGFFLIVDYQQERDGEVNFRGHGVYGWDPAAGRYTMHWFDSSGIDPGPPATGTWEEDTLTFQSDRGRGLARYTYVISTDEFSFKIEVAAAQGGDWLPFIEGTYRLVG